MFESVIGALGGGAAVAGGAAGVLGALYQNNSAHMEAEWARDWQANMSNTAHVREVADLKRAGLNPLLSVNKGASSPSASAPPVSDPVQSGVSSSLAVRANRASVDLMEAQAAQAAMQTTKTKEEADGAALENVIKSMIISGKMPEEIMNLVATRGATEAATAKTKADTRVSKQQLWQMLLGAPGVSASSNLRQNELLSSDIDRALNESGQKVPESVRRLFLRLKELLK